MPYAIMRFEKRKHGSINAMETHNERKKDNYASNPDIDKIRSENNFHLIRPQKRYYAEIMDRIEQAGCKKRKDSVLMVETLITASPEFMNQLPAEIQREFFAHALAFFQQTLGEKNVFVATVHMDEKTPHMHLCFTPITKDNRLSAKSILGNQKQLSQWQTDFHNHMSARWSELERGVSSMETGRKHIDLWMFKKAERMDKQLGDVKAALKDLKFHNAGKKKEEVLSILEKWVPEAQKLKVQVKSTDKYIKQLERDNSSLNTRVKQNNSQTNWEVEEAKDQAYKYKRIADRQKRLLQKVPKEVMEQIQAKEDLKQKRKKNSWEVRTKE